MKKVVVYTDGSCLGNPGPGGWAAILCLAGSAYSREICGGFRLTTNNRMEILAAISALEALKEPCEVEIHTDSQYLRDAVEKGWLKTWIRKNWIKSDKKPVLNVDLWRRLSPMLERHATRFIWLRGHAGHAQNERCDELARACAAGPNLGVDAVFEALRASGA